MKKTTLLLTAALLSSPLISACSTEMAIIGGATYGLLSQEEETNFTEQSYAVADYLIQPAQSFIRNGDLIIAEPLTDAEHPGMSSTLSKMIPERIGVRFSQLGYRTDLSKVATTEDVNYLKPSITKGEKPDFVLSGNYRARRDELDINMRIIDVRGNRVISAFDYVMPLSRDLKELATPKPQIMRVDQ